MTIGIDRDRKRSVGALEIEERPRKKVCTAKSINNRVEQVAANLLERLEEIFDFPSKNFPVQQLVKDYAVSTIRKLLKVQVSMGRRGTFHLKVGEEEVNAFLERVETTALIASEIYEKKYGAQIQDYYQLLLERYRERPVIREILRFKTDSISILSNSLQCVRQLIDPESSEGTELTIDEASITSILAPLLDPLDTRLKEYISVVNKDQQRKFIFPIQEFSSILLNEILGRIKNDISEGRKISLDRLPILVNEAFEKLISKVLLKYIKMDEDQAIHGSDGHCYGVSLSKVLNFPSPWLSAFIQERFRLKKFFQDFVEDFPDIVCTEQGILLNITLGSQIQENREKYPEITQGLEPMEPKHSASTFVKMEKALRPLFAERFNFRNFLKNLDIQESWHFSSKQLSELLQIFNLSDPRQLFDPEMLRSIQKEALYYYNLGKRLSV